MARRYRLVVIGTGSAATTVAARVREIGWSVAIVDFRPFAGTCALRGCDPKKLLVGAAEAVDVARRMSARGVRGELRIDWPALIAFERREIETVPAQRERRYREAGIDAFRGRARFTARNVVDVDGTVLEAEHVVIASGAEPARLGIPGEEHLITNEEFFALRRLPPRIVLVGGGYIAAEFSHVAAIAGAKVTIVHRGERMLKTFDPDLVDWLMEKFDRLGIEVRTKAEVTAIESLPGGGFRVHVEEGGGGHVDADLVVHAAGRVPALGELHPERAGVSVRNGRLELNEYLQSTSNPTVYAAGDAAQKGPPLTPVSSRDGEVVAENLVHGNRTRVDYSGIPSVAFTVPPIAAVGLGEEEARKQGRTCRARSARASEWYTARQAGEPVYGFKVLIDSDTDCILGAHLVGPHADELINVFALAIRNGLTAAQLRATMFGYPTAASDIAHML
ncbi:MAG TPA: NAD(P)/FAD-dependent oxidoreductase [Gammaproteobacteria bacterium]